MAAIKAHFGTAQSSEVERGAVRRNLRLEVLGTTSSGNVANVLIHNLSATGLLIETSANLTIGESFEVEIPHAGTTSAVVVWASERLFGCQFEASVTTAAVSAALLRSPVELPTPLALADAFVTQSQDGYADEDAEVQDKYSLRTRISVIVGLAVLCWAIVIGVTALILF